MSDFHFVVFECSVMWREVVLRLFVLNFLFGREVRSRLPRAQWNRDLKISDEDTKRPDQVKKIGFGM